mgnify:CR=1 FL=1
MASPRTPWRQPSHLDLSVWPSLRVAPRGLLSPGRKRRSRLRWGRLHAVRSKHFCRCQWKCKPKDKFSGLTKSRSADYVAPRSMLNSMSTPTRNLGINSMAQEVTWLVTWEFDFATHWGGGGVKLENLWNKKTQINSVGWQHARVDNNKTNKAQASRYWGGGRVKNENLGPPPPELYLGRHTGSYSL